MPCTGNQEPRAALHAVKAPMRLWGAPVSSSVNLAKNRCRNTLCRLSSWKTSSSNKTKTCIRGAGSFASRAAHTAKGALPGKIPTKTERNAMNARQYIFGWRRSVCTACQSDEGAISWIQSLLRASQAMK